MVATYGTGLWLRVLMSRPTGAAIIAPVWLSLSSDAIQVLLESRRQYLGGDVRRVAPIDAQAPHAARGR